MHTTIVVAILELICINELPLTGSGMHS